MIRIYVKNGPHEDAVRIELHAASMTVNRECMVSEKYLKQAQQLEAEGLIIIRDNGK